MTSHSSPSRQCFETNNEKVQLHCVTPGFIVLLENKLEGSEVKEKFIACIFRLSGEVEEKNRAITQLEERVRELEGNRKFMDSVDAGFVIVLFYI